MTPPPKEPVPSSPDHARSEPTLADALLALTPVIYRTARRLTRGVEDATAVTLEAARRASHSMMDPARDGSRTVVFAALWETLGERWRAQRHVPRDPAADSPDQLLASLLTIEDAELERRILSRLDASPDVDIALRLLAERERFTVLLVDVEDLDYEEVAQALGTDVADVRALLLGGRARLAVSLAEFARRPTGAHDLRDLRS